MKTAYELAMERLGGEDKSLSAEEKAALAEVDKVYEAKTAETRIMFEPKIETEQDPEKRQELEQELRHRISRLQSQRESKRNAVRDGT